MNLICAGVYIKSGYKRIQCETCVVGEAFPYLSSLVHVTHPPGPQTDNILSGLPLISA